MNVMFFLTPKHDVAYIYDDNTVKQVLEKMERSGYSAIPMIKRTGEYMGTINEGDLLWYIKNTHDLNMLKAGSALITDVPRRSDNTPVFAYNDIDELYVKALNQNFVPVVDGRGIFVGIVTRREIFKYFYKVHKSETLNIPANSR